MDSQQKLTLLKNFSSRLENFSAKLFGELHKSNTSTNILYSPLSIQTCVSMLRMGAELDATNELDEALCLSKMDVETIAEMFNVMMMECQKSPLLDIANKIYVKQGCGILATFNELVSTKFLSEIENINFNDNANASITINKWIAEKTNNMITKVVSPGDFSEMTRLVLVNAIHFKGKWKNPFDKKLTVNEPFLINDDKTTIVPMMYKKDYFGYGKLDFLNAQVLEMKYLNSDLSMLIVLPEATCTLEQLGQQLKSTTFEEIYKHLYIKKVQVKLPRFKAEFTQELTRTFENLGVGNIFNGQCLRNIFDYNEDVKVSSIIHKAIIEVDEEGTEAAAVSVLQTDGWSPTFKFIANKPFYFVILKNRSMPLFEGIINNPM